MLRAALEQHRERARVANLNLVECSRQQVLVEHLKRVHCRLMGLQRVNLVTQQVPALESAILQSDYKQLVVRHFHRVHLSAKVAFQDLVQFAEAGSRCLCDVPGLHNSIETCRKKDFLPADACILKRAKLLSVRVHFLNFLSREHHADCGRSLAKPTRNAQSKKQCVLEVSRREADSGWAVYLKGGGLREFGQSEDKDITV